MRTTTDWTETRLPGERPALPGPAVRVLRLTIVVGWLVVVTMAAFGAVQVVAWILDG